MALDVERNWAIAMAESKCTSSTRGRASRLSASDKCLVSTYIPSASPSRKKDNRGQAVYLPREVILHILSFVPIRPEYQSTLCACSLVSRDWYLAVIPLLYHSPFISSKNFKPFVNTICPSINVHVRKSELAGLVRRLDMGRLVHDGTKSLTARLLGRVKTGLEEFVAPQTSFAINCLASLTKCTHLRCLDLSLISQSINLKDLFHSISSLYHLETFYFPRSSTSYGHSSVSSYLWPPNLRHLFLSGSRCDEDPGLFSGIPLSLSHLTIRNCPTTSRLVINSLISQVGPGLRYLKIGYHMPRLYRTSLDKILLDLPVLEHLSIAAEFISGKFFVCAGHIKPPHPLRCFELDTSDTSHSQLYSDQLWIAVDSGGLGRLRKARIHRNLGWADTTDGRRDLEDLSELLAALASEEEEATGRRVETGVWIFPE